MSKFKSDPESPIDIFSQAVEVTIANENKCFKNPRNFQKVKTRVQASGASTKYRSGRNLITAQAIP
jgi:hypothetical protein